MRDFTASGGSIPRTFIEPDTGHCVSRRRTFLALTVNQQNCSAAEVSRLQFRQLAQMPPGSSVAAAGTSTAAKAQWVASDFLSQAEGKVPFSASFSKFPRSF